MISLLDFSLCRLSRENGGSTLVIKVDSYEPRKFHFNIKESADAQFNNIQYMYIGKNETMSEGFIGCVSRVEFDDIYPLKLLFQQKGPGNVKVLGGKFCVYCSGTRFMAFFNGFQNP